MFWGFYCMRHIRNLVSITVVWESWFQLHHFICPYRHSQYPPFLVLLHLSCKPLPWSMQASLCPHDHGQTQLCASVPLQMYALQTLHSPARGWGLFEICLCPWVHPFPTVFMQIFTLLLKPSLEEINMCMRLLFKKIPQSHISLATTLYSSPHLSA